jgi:hypothetical protein
MLNWLITSCLIWLGVILVIFLALGACFYGDRGTSWNSAPIKNPKRFALMIIGWPFIIIILPWLICKTVYYMIVKNKLPWLDYSKFEE